MNQPTEMGHVAVVPPRLVTGVPRLDPIWFERFASSSVPDVSDAVGALYTVSPGIRNLGAPKPPLVGQALTVKCWPGDNLAIYGAFARSQPGDVLVVDNRGFTGACGSGANVLKQPLQRGLRGVVIDGGWRDLDEADELGVPIFGRARSSFSPPKRRPGEVNVPVHCGGVVVEPGDLILGDDMGVVVVPRAHAGTVWDALESRRSSAEDSDAATPESERQRNDGYLAAFAAGGGIEERWNQTDGGR